MNLTNYTTDDGFITIEDGILEVFIYPELQWTGNVWDINLSELFVYRGLVANKVLSKYENKRLVKREFYIDDHLFKSQTYQFGLSKVQTEIFYDINGAIKAKRHTDMEDKIIEEYYYINDGTVEFGSEHTYFMFPELKIPEADGPTISYYKGQELIKRQRLIFEGHKYPIAYIDVFYTKYKPTDIKRVNRY